MTQMKSGMLSEEEILLPVLSFIGEYIPIVLGSELYLTGHRKTITSVLLCPSGL